jgi:hypothetical protein
MFIFSFDARTNIDKFFTKGKIRVLEAAYNRSAVKVVNLFLTKS